MIKTVGLCLTVLSIGFETVGMGTLFTKIRGLPTSVRPRKHIAEWFIFALSLADCAFIFVYFAFVMDIFIVEIQQT